MFAHDAEKKIDELTEAALGAPDDAAVVAEADRLKPVGGRGWAGKFQPKYRAFSQATLCALRKLFIASKISAEDAATEVHLSDPENPLVVHHVVEHRVKNFFGKLAAAKKAHIDLNAVTDAAELEGRMVNSVAELKAECVCHGLKTAGNKTDLCARLDRHDLGQTTSSDKSAAGKLGAHGHKTVQELNAEIEQRNATRDKDKIIQPASKKKRDLAAALLEDDAEECPQYLPDDDALLSNLLTREATTVDAEDPLTDED
jgi:hypothetical protein